MNKKGFLLVDAIINVLIVSIVSSLCLYMYIAINKADDGYVNYLENENDNYERIFNSLSECEACLIDEPD